VTKRVALVTGASSGIGRATARALAADGLHVIVHYGPDREGAVAVVEEIRAAGGTADLAGANFLEASAPAALAQEVARLSGGRLDVLVANAGIACVKPFEDYELADFDDVFAINVRAPFFLVQALLPTLADGASVVMVSSTAARHFLVKASGYAATKGAVDTLVRQLASELGPRGIRVNAVAPGITATEMSNLSRSEEGRARILATQALQRLGRPEDIADVIAFLASDKARWIDGVTIPVDGGGKI